jgi:uncharacterized protein YggE
MMTAKRQSLRDALEPVPMIRRRTMKRVFLSALFVLARVPLDAQQPDARPRPEVVPQVSVSAVGSIKREPDQAVLNIAVESAAPTARAASQANATKMDALIAAVKAMGIPATSIHTTSYQLDPDYSYPQPGQNTPPRITQYRAINTVQITVDTVARAGRVIDAAVANGANRLNGISFQIRDQDGARVDALRDAVRKARTEAEAIAQSLGQHLGSVLFVSTSYQSVMPPPRPYMAMAKVAEQAMSTPIEPGQIEMQATINVTYRLEN